MTRIYIGGFVLAWLVVLAVFFVSAQVDVTAVVVPCGGEVSMLNIPQTGHGSVDAGKAYIDAQIAQGVVVGWLIVGNRVLWVRASGQCSQYRAWVDWVAIDG